MTDSTTTTLSRLCASELCYNDLPDFEVFNAAAWAVQDSIEQAIQE